MILVTGGAFQGKLEFAKNLLNMSDEERPVIVEGELLQEKDAGEADIIAHFHLYIRRLLEEGRDVREAVGKLLLQNPNLILEVTELGCGIVPVDAFDRNYRETVGRICCELAEEAEAVYRVHCGIGIRIK